MSFNNVRNLFFRNIIQVKFISFIVINMQIKELLNYLKINSDDERIISEIVTSTKDVVSNCVLILCRGHNIDPCLFINDEIKSKCLLILTDRPVEGGCFILNLKNRVFEILDYFYFRFNHHFKIIGITGTEGKSSLSKIIFQSLKIIHRKPLLITTEKTDKDMISTDLTTPTSKEIINAMIKAEKEQYDYLIMEVSCISISEKRVDEKIFDYLFLTNLETDHLDYYDNVYQYHISKISLFQKNIKAKKFIFRETFDKYPNMFNHLTNLNIIENKEIKLKRSSLTHQVFAYKNHEYYSHLIFGQNRRNLAMLIEFLQTIKVYNSSFIVKRIKRILGRLDLIKSRPYVLIDYAHSSKSVENVLKELSSFKQNQLIVVIGAGGNRDKQKRAEYGKICLKYADKIFVTNDNPRNEDPLTIAKAIMVNKDERFILELNRKNAIKKAMKMADQSDIVAILGRGNEEYQIVGNKRIYLSDYEEAKKCFIK